MKLIIPNYAQNKFIFIFENGHSKIQWELGLYIITCLLAIA